MLSRFKTGSRAYPIYLTMEFASSLFFSMIFTVNMVYQVTTVGLNPLQLVLVGTTLEVTAFLFEVPTGVVADVYSRRLSIIIGMFVMGLGFVVEGSLPRFEMILLGQVLWGIGYTFTSGATEAWIADEVGEAQAARAFMRASQVGTMGSLIGIGAGTVLGNVTINLPIVLGGVALIALGLVLMAIMPETGFQPMSRTNRNTFQSMAHTFNSGLRLVRGNPVLISILTIGLIYGLYSEGFDRLWTAHLLQNFTLPKIDGLEPVTWFGIIRAVSEFLGIGVTEFARKRTNTRHHGSIARAIFSFSTAMVAGLFTFALTGDFVIALIAYWAFSSSRQTVGPLYTGWVNQQLESGVRATVISMSSQIDAFGQIVGGPIVGAIGVTFGVRYALAASALILSPVLLLLIRVIRRDRMTSLIVSETAVAE